MAEDAPKAPKTVAPTRKKSAAKTGAANAASKPHPVKSPKGQTVDDTTTIENPTTTGANATGSGGPAFNTQALKDGAATLKKQAGDKARDYVEDGKARAGGALDELSKMLGDAAGTVDEKLGAQYGQYARSAADAVAGFSESLKSKQIDDLIADATGFVKKSPAIAIGTAAAVGFVLVRLIKSGLDAAETGIGNNDTRA